MRDYFLIESTLAEGGDTAPQPWRFAGCLAGQGECVSLYLLGNAVLLAHRDRREARLGALLASGVRVLADEDSLRERNMAPPELFAGVQPASLERVLDALAAGTRVHWC